MRLRDRWRVFERNPTVRAGLFVTGIIVIILSPIVGAIPGPGGVFVFAFGLGLCLKYSIWARRRYVRFKRRWPRHGKWADWGLRRASAKRRAALEREQN